MKPKKKKFDIKAFFIDHCEKIALALVIPAAIYVGLQGTKFEPLPWQPDALRKAADDADTHIKSNERTAVDEGVSITQYDVKAQWIKAKIRSDLYRTEVKWMPSLFPEKNKRGPVDVLSVTDLRASSGLGAVAINSGTPAAIALGAQPGTSRMGRRWVVVTGLIPVKKQLDLYLAAYASSVFTSPDRDTPTYFFYDVERAEVGINSNPNNFEWKRLNVFKAINEDQILWAGMGTDPVDPTFLAPIPSNLSIPMAYPLPPVTNRFGEEVSHPPLIPMLTDTQMTTMQIQEEREKKMIQRMIDIDERTILNNRPFTPTTATGTEAFQPRGETEDEMQMQMLTVTDYLFRFFDFSVETGKTYRYRVRLYLANPNGSLGASLLEDETLSKEPYLVTEFSVPSNQVTIPLGARILASGTFAPSVRTPWAEPAASLYAIHFEMKDGSEWYIERERVFRGQTVNYGNAEVVPFEKPPQAAAMDGSELGQPPPGPPRGGPRPRGGPLSTPAPAVGDKMTVNLVSEVCVLDVLGGSILPKTAGNIPDMRSPGKVIVLEPSGAMRVRKVVTDLAEIDRLKNPDSAGGGGRGGFPGAGFMESEGSPGI